jgi:purine-nucleoside phosphorylase
MVLEGLESGAQGGLPARVGREQAKAAARWLRNSLGEPPEMAVVLGSGLSFAHEEPPVTTVSYQAIPHWRVGSVEGHPQMLGLAMFEGRLLAILQGRIHEYEGFDVSEVQLPIRSLGEWGVRKIVLTSASGAVSSDISVGTVVAADTVLDLHHLKSTGGPGKIPATDPDLAEALLDCLDTGGGLAEGAHASVPGPQYETPAELEVLSRAGVVTVSMSPASELRAAREAELEVAVLLVVTNAGTATHAQVLEASEAATEVLTRPLAALACLW